MNKSMLTGIVIGGTAALSLGAAAGYQAIQGPDYADVVQVAAVHETVKVPVQVCQQVQVSRQAKVKDEHRIAGTVIGGVLGGALGSQVGGGNGKKAATVIGVLGGGYAGNRIQKNMQEKDRVSHSEQRCKTVLRTEDKLRGYDVQYRLDDKLAVIRMAQPPTSNRIPVEDGQLMLSAVTAPPVTAPVVSN